MSNKKPTTPLSEAASGFENELRRFEEIVEQLRKLDISSEKNLQRGRKALEDCAASEQVLAAELTAFVKAMQAAQARQQTAMEQVGEAAKRLHARYNERQTLLERVARLGECARAINEPAASASEVNGDPQAMLAVLAEVTNRTDEAIAEAAVVVRAAEEGNWQDIARDTDSLKQQLEAARNRILLAQRGIASRAPS
jgi:hypothetical protein